MLDLNPDRMREEIEESIDFQRDHTDPSNEIIKSFAGRGYRRSWGDGQAHPENHAYEWCTNVRGLLVSSAPVIRVSAPGFEDNDQIKAHEMWMNDWIAQVQLVNVLRSIAVAMQFRFCPVAVLMEPAQDGSDWFRDQASADPPLLRPVVKRIPAPMFYADHRALGRDQWRYAGHIVIQDKDDMLREVGMDGRPKFDRKAIETLGVDDGVAETYRAMGLPLRGQERKQIVRYEHYIRDTGMVYSLAFGPTPKGEKAVFLRKPRPFAGPRKGPYVIFGGVEVPEQLYPLSPLPATKDQSEDINAHARQAAHDAGTAKRLVVVDGAPGVADMIRVTNSGGVLAIPGFTGLLQTIQFGGAMPETLNYLNVARERLDRVSGLTETVRGNITGATAEEIHTAQANRNVRTRDMQTEFRQCLLEVIRLAGWHGWHNPSVGADGLQETLPDGSLSEPLDYRGGIDPMNPIPFDAVRYTIEENSMEFVDEFLKQQAMQQTVQMVLEISDRVITHPHVNWTRLLDDMCETVNIRQASEKYLNGEMLQHMQAMNVMAGMGAMGGGGMGGPSAAGAPADRPGKPKPGTKAPESRTEAKAAGSKRAAARR